MDQASAENLSGDLATCLGLSDHICQRTVLGCPHKHTTNDEQGCSSYIIEWLREAAQDPDDQCSQERSAQRSGKVRGDDLIVEERAPSVWWQQHGCAIETSYRP